MDSGGSKITDPGLEHTALNVWNNREKYNLQHTCYSSSFNSVIFIFWCTFLIFQTLFQIDIETEYDLIQLVGEGWFSRVYLAGKLSSSCC